IDGYITDSELTLDWPDSLKQAVGLRGLRHELRELSDRSAEYGIQPGQLEELGHARGRPERRIAAAILQDYRDVQDLSGADAYDPSGLITSDGDLWEDDPLAAATEAARIQNVVIDDFQEAPPAIHRLVQLLGTKRDFVITANPD